MELPYQLLHGDCHNLLKEIPDNSIDLICCDIPYQKIAESWDVLLDMNIVWPEYLRILKPNCNIVLFSIQPLSSDLIVNHPKEFRREIIWDKGRSTDFMNANKTVIRCHENIILFADVRMKLNPLEIP